MTIKEIEIIVDDDQIYDMLLYIYCLRRAPEQLSNVQHVRSEIKQVEKTFLSELQRKKNSFV